MNYLHSYLTTYIKISVTCILGLEVKFKIIKFLEKNLEEYLHDLWIAKTT